MEERAPDRWTGCGLLGGFSENLLVGLSGGKVLAGAAWWPEGRAGGSEGSRGEALEATEGLGS